MSRSTWSKRNWHGPRPHLRRRDDFITVNSGMLVLSLDGGAGFPPDEYAMPAQLVADLLVQRGYALPKDGE